MILKPLVDDTSWAKYCLISLLNVDVKLQSKVLATRLNTGTRQLIHKDQVGFVLIRQAGDNVCQSHTTLQNPTPTAVARHQEGIRLPLMALFYILWKWGFDPQFCNWIADVYSTPMAHVKYPGYRSAAFSIHKGTSQGCPLSPLLFDLTIEPLAQLIRTYHNITDLKVAVC